MCDRNNNDVPTSQIGFLRRFILSSFDSLVKMFPKLQFTVDNAESNIRRWTKFQSQKIYWVGAMKKMMKKKMRMKYNYNFIIIDESCL